MSGRNRTDIALISCLNAPHLEPNQVMLETFLEVLFQSMILKSFDEQFPNLAGADPCKICIDDGDPEVDGVYDVIDYYCPDPECDCQKVTAILLDSDKNQRATIAYGWESYDFYMKWGNDSKTSVLLPHGFLDPLGQQSEQAPRLLKAFSQMMKNTKFKDRFKSRYNSFKTACTDEEEKPSRNNVINFPSNKRR